MFCAVTLSGILKVCILESNVPMSSCCVGSGGINEELKKNIKTNKKFTGMDEKVNLSFHLLITSF